MTPSTFTLTLFGCQNEVRLRRKEQHRSPLFLLLWLLEPSRLLLWVGSVPGGSRAAWTARTQVWSHHCQCDCEDDRAAGAGGVKAQSPAQVLLSSNTADCDWAFQQPGCGLYLFVCLLCFNSAVSALTTGLKMSFHGCVCFADCSHSWLRFCSTCCRFAGCFVFMLLLYKIGRPEIFGARPVGSWVLSMWPLSITFKSLKDRAGRWWQRRCFMLRAWSRNRNVLTNTTLMSWENHPSSRWAALSQRDGRGNVGVREEAGWHQQTHSLPSDSLGGSLRDKVSAQGYSEPSLLTMSSCSAERVRDQQAPQTDSSVTRHVRVTPIPYPQERNGRNAN